MNNSKLRLLEVLAVLLVFLLILSVVSGMTGIAAPEPSSSAAVSPAVAGRGTGSPLFSETDCNSKGICTEMREGFTTVLENDGFRLYFNKANGQTALLSKSDGGILYSNPSDTELEGEALLAGTDKERLKAQFVLKYITQNGSGYLKDSFNDSVAYGNMTFKTGDGVLKVSYVLGRNVITLSDIPQQLSAARYETVISAMTEKDAKEFASHYQKASLTGKTDPDIIKSYKEKYPNIENGDVYYIRHTSELVLAKISELLAASGYTSEDLKNDNEENGVIAEKTENVRITVPLEYSLTDSGLRVSVVSGGISAPADIIISEIALLPQFGCGSVNDSGYIVLPDGSGTLMYFNNGKTDTSFGMRVYGDDTSYGNLSDYQSDNKLSLPVFGIKKNAAAFLAEITEGETMANVCAGTSGSENSFNCAYARFVCTSSDTIKLAKGSELTAAEKQPYRGNFTVSYSIMGEGRKNYTGMAQTYRERLISDGRLSVSEPGFTLTADLIGGATVSKNVMGIPVSSAEALTTFEEMTEISQQLKNDGVDRLSLRIEGWFNGGISQGYAAQMKITKALGGAEGLSALNKAAAQSGTAVFARLFLGNVAATGYSFNKSSMNIRGISGDSAVRYEYDYVSRYRKFNNRSVMQLTPALFEKTAIAFNENTESFTDMGTDVGDVGSILYSDFSDKHYYSREESKNAAVTALERLAGKSLAVTNPNVYALKSCRMIFDLPASDSAFSCCDESIPFYQTVLHGVVSYVCPPINYADDARAALLNALEYGSGIQYTLAKKSTAVLKNTAYSYINRGRIEEWQEQLTKDYKEISDILIMVEKEMITAHERLGDSLYRTAYGSKAVVYVNYGNDDVIYGDVSVPANGFAVNEINKGEDF